MLLTYCSGNQLEAPKNNKGGLFIGNYQTIEDSNYLKNNKITHILSLTTYFPKTDNIKNLKIKHLHIKAEDSENFDLFPFFEKCSFFIDENLKKGNVLVHCLGGVSRSVSIVIAYFIRFRNIGFDQGLKFIKEKRPFVDPNDGFVKQLRKYEGIYLK